MLYRNEVLTISAYIIRRLLQAVLIVIIVTFLVFFLVYQLPGDPVEMLISANMTQDVTPELIEQLRHEKGLDRPIVVQYVDWLGDAIRGDWGRSLMQNYDIAQEIGSRLLVSLSIGLGAFLLGLILGPGLKGKLQAQ